MVYHNPHSWILIWGFNSINDKWSCFEDNIHRKMYCCIPSKWTSSRYNLPWFNHSLKHLARHKQRLYNKAKTSGKHNDWKAFHVARKLMHDRLKETRNAYISDYLVACVASVSLRVRRESWDESKKKGMTGEGEGNDFVPALTFAQ